MSIQKLNDSEMSKVSGGVGGTSDCTVKAVGNPHIMSCRQEKCVRCGSSLLIDRLFSMDNGRTIYNGQECECGNVMIYGDSIM